MAYEIMRIDGATLYARISGTMRLSDQQSLQSAGLNLIGQGRKLRLFVALEDFQGWEKGGVVWR